MSLESIPVSPSLLDVGLFVVIAVFLLGGIKHVIAIIDYFKQKPPAHEQYVKIQTCKELREASRENTEKTQDELQSEIKNIRDGDSEGRSKIHRDVRRVEERLARVEGQNEIFNQRQVAMDGKLDSLPERILKILNRD